MASSQTLGDALKRVARYSQITNEALVVGYRETRCTGPTPPVAVSRLSHAAKVAAIHHGDAGLEHGMDGRDGFRVAGVPIAARHAHDAGTVSSQSNKPHLNLPGFSGAQF